MLFPSNLARRSSPGHGHQSIVFIIQFISTHEISDVGCGCLSHANQFSDSPDAHQVSCNSVRF